jgi:hypothetical protein
MSRSALRVDGADLRQLLGQVQEGGRIRLPADVALESRHLRGQPDPALTFESKPAILVCGQCADRYCGMTIMRVTFEGAEVRWSEFEDVWFDGASGEWDRERLDAGPFIFDLAEYEQALSPT